MGRWAMAGRRPLRGARRLGQGCVGWECFRGWRPGWQRQQQQSIQPLWSYACPQTRVRECVRVWVGLLSGLASGLAKAAAAVDPAPLELPVPSNTRA